jgi:hypothetical protein
MSDAYVDKVAGQLAELALADEKRSDDEKIVGEIAEILGASSQTLQEAYLTAIRVRRAEARARKLLVERSAAHIADKSRMIEDLSDEPAPRAHGTVFERERAPDGSLDPKNDRATDGGARATAPAPGAPKAEAPSEKSAFSDALDKNIESLADMASSDKTEQAPKSVTPQRTTRR